MTEETERDIEQDIGRDDFTEDEDSYYDFYEEEFDRDRDAYEYDQLRNE